MAITFFIVCLIKTVCISNFWWKENSFWWKENKR